MDASHRGSHDSSGSSWTGSSRQSSTEVDCRYSNDPRPWSSTDSDSSYQWASPAPKPRQPANHSWDARGTGASMRNNTRQWRNCWVAPSERCRSAPPARNPKRAHFVAARWKSRRFLTHLINSIIGEVLGVKTELAAQIFTPEL